ncbi:MAG: hypothetical protein KC416_09810 [Myxococcales bacterium]|nr:hypothetical protein [Myxococcales bacterium]
MGRALVGAWLLIATLGGCGRIGFGSAPQGNGQGDASVDAGNQDAGTDADAPSEDASVTRSCSGAWGTPTIIESLDVDGRDDDPSFTADLLELYFASKRPGGPQPTNLWRSLRATTRDPWGTPTLVEEIGPVNTPHVSSDGLSLWLSRSVGSGDEDIFVSTRDSRNDPWGSPTAVEELNEAGFDDKSPAPYSNSLRILFTSDRPGGEGDLDFYRARRDKVGDRWGDIERIATVSTSAFEARPWPIQSGQRVYFHSIRTPLTSADIFMATFSPKNLEYEEAVLLDALSSPTYDEDIVVSDDECYAILSSDRDGTPTLYESHREP